MKLKTLCCNVLLAIVAAIPMAAQQCTDAAEESHHKVLFENQNVRILALQLGRIESTSVFCYANPYLHIATSEGSISISSEGGPFTSHDEHTGEGLFSGLVKKLVIRNNSASLLTEIIVETKRSLPNNVYYNNTSGGGLEGEVFSPEAGTGTGTFTTSFSIGSLAGSRTRLAPGESSELSSPDHALIALNDVKLQIDGGTTLQLSAGTMRILEIGKAAKLKNMSDSPARFITIEF